MRKSARFIAFLALASLFPALGLAQTAPKRWVRISPNNRALLAANLAKEALGTDIQTSSQAAPQPLLLSESGEDQNVSALALTCADPVIGYEVPQDKSSVIIALKEPKILNTVKFYNVSGEGKVTVSTALTRDALQEKRFTSSGFAVYNADNREITVRITGADAKFIKVDFEMVQPGRVYAFGAFGTDRVSDYHLSMVPENTVEAGDAKPKGARKKDKGAEAAVGINLASLSSGAQLAYVSSGNVKDAINMLDGDPSTSYKFDEQDAAPMVVVDLGRSLELNRISCLYTTKENCRWEAFFLGKLEETENWKGDLALAPDFLKEIKPLATSLDEEARHTLAINTKAEGRYLILRAVNPSSNQVSNLVKGTSSLVSQVAANVLKPGLIITEVGAFSNAYNSKDYVMSGEGDADGQGDQSSGYVDKNPKNPAPAMETNDEWPDWGFFPTIGPVGGFFGIMGPFPVLRGDFQLEGPVEPVSP